MKTVDFSKTIEACALKVCRYRHLIDFMKVCEYLEPRSSDPAVVGSSPGWGEHICACHIEV